MVLCVFSSKPNIQTNNSNLHVDNRHIYLLMSVYILEMDKVFPVLLPKNFSRRDRDQKWLVPLMSSTSFSIKQLFIVNIKLNMQSELLTEVYLHYNNRPPKSRSSLLMTCCRPVQFVCTCHAFSSVYLFQPVYFFPCWFFGEHRRLSW